MWAVREGRRTVLLKALTEKPWQKLDKVWKQLRSKTFLATWGNGDHGRLGHGDDCHNEESPRLCNALIDVQVQKVACGGAHTLILDKSGNVYSMGLNDKGQLGQGHLQQAVTVPKLVKGIDSPVKSIAAGFYHSACITEDGKIWLCGSNSQGQLGLGKGIGGQSSAFKLNEYLIDYSASKVALGAAHTVAIAKDGSIFSWGTARHGVLGHGSGSRSFFGGIKNEYTPRKIRALEALNIIEIACGHDHSGCVDDMGRVYTWGNGSFWKLGLDKDIDVWTPQKVPELGHITYLAFGSLHSIALTHDGDILVWGANQNGCVGLGRKSSNTRRPASLEYCNIKEISCGWKHSAAITDSGELLTWGWGGSMGSSATRDAGGQLGHSNTFDYWEPTSVVRPVISTASAGKMSLNALHISCGFNHTCAIYSSDEPDI